MKTIITLNSTYEIDEGDPMRVRRVKGRNAATPNFGADEVWHELHSVQRIGPCYLFVFADGNSTMTSLVQDVR